MAPEFPHKKLIYKHFDNAYNLIENYIVEKDFYMEFIGKLVDLLKATFIVPELAKDYSFIVEQQNLNVKRYFLNVTLSAPAVK
ncbi:hypothetical protein SAMN05421821_101455 [Mucilaginibacter lappiensis]|uniref:Uncharacterized protein n=1 Tax=Mucilaginibacter lappiensis TaxID=354630 RepID=A0ABR6PCZ7_9SPHI|nr:hypothetical protein [Mucilaginibacter lappiensis]MBB6107627.1 hypothetical protein [Mucilaginibacter lappiensis]SIQ02435.1 hypothetical protein SAMN05421821_101455 [Mucilaginibacter lappiensis]